jgi:hypothetical protein
MVCHVGRGKTVKLAALTPRVLEKIKTWRYDRLLEKHEGPESWATVLKFYAPEFLEINGYHVLLPIVKAQHPNITVLRCIVGDNGRTLTLFLKDTSHILHPEDERFFAGRVAVCDKFENEEFFVAIMYHEWFIIENH